MANTASSEIIASGAERLEEALQMSEVARKRLIALDRRIDRWCKPRFPFGIWKVIIWRYRMSRRMMRKHKLVLPKYAVYVSKRE